MTPKQILRMHNRDDWYKHPLYLGIALAAVIVFACRVLPRLIG